MIRTPARTFCAAPTYLEYATRPFNRSDMFQARFIVRARGLTMRLFVPPPTAAPCVSAGVSETFTS